MTGPLAPLFAQVQRTLGLHRSMTISRETPSLRSLEELEQALAALSAIERHVQDMEKALLLYTGYTEMVKRDPDYDMDGIEWEHIYEQARAALPASNGGPDGPAGTPEGDAR